MRPRADEVSCGGWGLGDRFVRGGWWGVLRASCKGMKAVGARIQAVTERLEAIGGWPEAVAAALTVAFGGAPPQSSTGPWGWGWVFE